jgi:S1-C subfamily serine protease
VTAAVVTTACADDGPATTPDVREVAAVACDRPLPSLGVGLVVADGLVATAAHVVDGPRRTVSVDGMPARVVAVDARTDLALLATSVDGAARLVDRPTGGVMVRTTTGDLMATIVDTGSLVVHDTSAQQRHERDVHTIRPGVARGTSGAPLVDERGAVLGLVVLDNPTDGTAYATTSAELAGLLAATPERHADVPCRE